METKVKRTMQDAVEAYDRKAIKEAEEEEKRIAELEAETIDLLNKAKLDYLRVEEGNVAVFEYDGDIIKIRVWGTEHNMHIQRIGACPKCGQEIVSWTKDWVTNLADIGELVVNPTWDHHFHYARQNETSEQRLISALRDALGLNQEY